MPDSPILPNQRSWKDGGGNPLPVEFFKFFRELLSFVQQAGGNSVDISGILARLDALEAAGNATIQGLASVLVQGSLADGNVQLLLDGDEASPDASSYYGTDEAGAKGFHAFPETPSMLPIVTGEIVSGQPVFVIGPDGSLIYGPVA